jgi:hypothetical protein
MTAFQGAVDATFAAFGIDAVYAPAGGESGAVRVIARRPDTIVGFGETRIHAETATFELRASEVATLGPAISSLSAARPSSSRVSRNGAIPIGWCGPWTSGFHELGRCPLVAHKPTLARSSESDAARERAPYSSGPTVQLAKKATSFGTT